MLKEVTNSLYFDYYKENIFLLEAVIEKLLERVYEIENKREANGQRRIVDNVRYRIKSPDSMVQKLKRRGFEESVNSAMENVYDAAGIRIICPYIDDVYTVAAEIRRCSDIEVMEVKDYIRNPKKNGYRSYHMIVRTAIVYNGETHFVNCEIQIRSMVMNSWASAEHQLKYKKDVTDEGSVALLKRTADEMLKIDYSMMKIRDLILVQNAECRVRCDVTDGDCS